MSFEKLLILIFSKDLTISAVWVGLIWDRTLRSKVMAWLSYIKGSNWEILEAIVEVDLAI